MPASYARVVVHTNVLLSVALVPWGTPAMLVDRLLLEGRLVFSTATFVELETRVWKPKFDRYLPMERRKRLLGDFSASALWVEPSPAVTAKAYSRDAGDDAFIHAAMAADARRCPPFGHRRLMIY